MNPKVANAGLWRVSGIERDRPSRSTAARYARTLWRAPAKINLTLHILARRADGYHELESLVAFAGACDWLEFTPSGALELDVEGPTALAAGPADGNLVMRAARSLQAAASGLRLGRFRLHKNLPVAAGLGGGSSDAAAALRALAFANGIASDDPRLSAAARATGADVLVCLAPRARAMGGIGDRIGPALDLAPLPAVLINPGVAVLTPEVFAGLGLARGAVRRKGLAFDFSEIRGPADIFAALGGGQNDLQMSARAIAPAIGDALTALAGTVGARFARMSGSGATCFALYDDRRAAARAARKLKADHPAWWVRATYLR